MSDATRGSHESLTPNGFMKLFRDLGELQAYPPEMELFSQGDMIRDVYLIEAGWVRLTHTDHEGREVVVTFRSPGKLLGVAALDTQKPLRVSAITVNECRMYRLSATRFLEQVNKDLELSRCLRRTLAQQFYDLADDLGRLATLSTRAGPLKFAPQATQRSCGNYCLLMRYSKPSAVAVKTNRQSLRSYRDMSQFDSTPSTPEELYTQAIGLLDQAVRRAFFALSPSSYVRRRSAILPAAEPAVAGRRLSPLAHLRSAGAIGYVAANRGESRSRAFPATRRQKRRGGRSAACQVLPTACARENLVR